MDNIQVYLNATQLAFNETIAEYIGSHNLDGYKLPFSLAGTLLLAVVGWLVTRRFLYGSSSSKHEKAIKFSIELPDEAKPHWKGKRLQPAAIKNDEEPEYIQSYCPATGQFLGKYKSNTRDEIDEIIGKAAAAQETWKNTTFAQRRQVLRSMSEFIVKNQENIARVACRDSGKTLVDASMGEILVTLEKLNWIIKHGEKALTPSKRAGPSNILMSYKGAEVRYEPLGVVSALVSWNYPFHNMLGPIIAAIFTGNAIVVKCSEQVVWSSQFYIKLVKTCLKACGHDPELVQLVCTWPKDADYFTSHEGLSHITFIGSRPVAHHVCKAAAESLTPVVVELGGKDAFMVLDDAKDLNAIASIIMRGTFQSAGQNCIGIERVIVTEKNYDKLVAILEKRVPQLRLGSDIDQLEDIDMGATISDARFEILSKQIQEAVSQGARLLAGGNRYQHPNYPQGHYFSPTLLVDLTTDMEIAREEVFGPVLSMFKAKDTEDAIRIANSTEYALGGSVFGSDWKQLNYVANSIKTGNVAINDFATFYVCQLPFGGTKGSGYGKFGGEEGLQGLCNAKSVCFDKIPFVSTQIPPPLDYPIKNEEKAWGFVKALNIGGYDVSWWNRIKAVGTLAKNAS
ncbi:CYFA0S18e01046g1_1 [Cyberlindnera fabianii]|uniref:CYFA0S18e01046g1_1 n=1 Tax=Cyberlindnera fabianii TaxID=36022 RepID=A0A061BEM4_CYBFA|nr:Succinate-semialdehyde dehydrogenase [NADP(+)] [Cyberlindnera fabianii]CDR45403.1 CYFA0S18e01046g1_1 [Cyberlindnera fabianii]